jgi:enolase-phosphatase E1
MRAWHGRGLRLAIYSSGSIEAQQLYLANSVAGDLTPIISGYFDTTSGAKGEPASYVAIAAALHVPARDITFFSDAPAETTAAEQSGVRVYRVDRARPPSFEGRDGNTTVIGSFAPVVERVR